MMSVNGRIFPEIHSWWEGIVGWGWAKIRLRCLRRKQKCVGRWWVADGRNLNSGASHFMVSDWKLSPASHFLLRDTKISIDFTRENTNGHLSIFIYYCPILSSWQIPVGHFSFSIQSKFCITAMRFKCKILMSDRKHELEMHFQIFMWFWNYLKARVSLPLTSSGCGFRFEFMGSDVLFQ